MNIRWQKSNCADVILQVDANITTQALQHQQVLQHNQKALLADAICLPAAAGQRLASCGRCSASTAFLSLSVANILTPRAVLRHGDCAHDEGQRAQREGLNIVACCRRLSEHLAHVLVS